MNTIHRLLPNVNIHCCPACQLPNHWITDTCRDEHCPWTHHRDSYGRLVGLMGECTCTLEAITESLVAVLPNSGYLGSVVVRVPSFWLIATENGQYQPTADEWLEIIAAVVHEQRSMGGHDVLGAYRDACRDMLIDGQSILQDEAWMRRHPGC